MLQVVTEYLQGLLSLVHVLVCGAVCYAVHSGCKKVLGLSILIILLKCKKFTCKLLYKQYFPVVLFTII